MGYQELWVTVKIGYLIYASVKVNNFGRISRWEIRYTVSGNETRPVK